MGSVAQLHDPDGDRLIRLAKSLGEREPVRGRALAFGEHP